MTERGNYQCNVPGYEAVWVSFAERGYPHKWRRLWPTMNEDEILAIVLDRVTDWHLPDVAGQPLTLPTDRAAVSVFDDVELAVLAWLVKVFATWWLKEMHQQPAMETQP